MSKSFGELLRSNRTEKKISLRKLEELTEISFSHLSKIERGEYKPSRESVEVIAEALELDEDMCLISAGYAPEELMKLEIIPKDTDDSLAEITKLIKEFGIEDMGFFDIDKWKNLGPEDIEKIRSYFEFIAEEARKRNNKN